MRRLSYTNKRCVSFALALATFSLALRLVWVASRTETGWETVAVSWHEATLGRAGLPRNRFEIRDPEQHVRFWRERLMPALDRSAQDADLTMTAAWVVEHPVSGLQTDLVDLRGFTRSERVLWSTPGFWQGFSEQYNTVSTPTVLEFADTATELEPSQRSHWRRRALLLICGYPSQPKIAEWREVLKEAKSHDPNNALYDYIATICLWNASTRYDYDSGAVWTVVEDDEVFNEGWQCFEKGLNENSLKVDHVNAESIRQLLSTSRLTQLEASRIALRRSYEDRAFTLLRQLTRHLEGQAESKRRDGDFRSALRLLQSANGIFDQFEPQPRSAAMVSACRTSLLDHLLDPSSDNLALLSDEQWDAYETQEHDSLVRMEVRAEARRQLSQDAEIESPFDAAFPVLLMEYMQSLVAGMLICGLLAIAAARIIPHAEVDVVRFGVWRHLLVWCVSFGLTFVVLGLSPTDMIEREDRQIAIVAAAWILGGGFSIWLARTLIRQCRQVVDSRGRLALVAVLLTWATTWAILFGLTMPIITWDHEDVMWWLAGLPVTVLMMGIIIPVLALGMLFDLIRRRYRMKKRLPGEYVMAGWWLLLVTASVLLVSWTLPAFNWEVEGLPASAPQWAESDPVRGISPNSPERWRSTLQVARDSWQWGVAQWTAYHGPLVTPLLGLLLTGVWYAVQAWKRSRRAGETGSTKRWSSFCNGCSRCLGESAILLAVAALLVYLVLAPFVVAQFESEHIENLTRLRPDGTYWSKLAEIEQEVLADPEAMQRIEEQLNR